MPFPSKHVLKSLSAPVRINNFSANGATAIVTSAITTALATAGEGSVSVPLQISSGSAIGVITTGANNRVEVYSATSKQKIANGSNNEVYGRITESGGVYTLSFFTLPSSGSEAVHTFASATSIDFEFNYRFDFARFPADGIISARSRNVSDDPFAIAGGGLTPRMEVLTVTSLNTINSLSFVPANTTTIALIVNGETFDTLGGAAAPFSVSGQAISWSAVNARMPLETTDRVIASYYSA